MREILFRGKRVDNGEWVEGMLVRYNPELEVANMADEFEILVPVNTKTVGQFTGLTDKNGKKIFEGDILEFSDRIVVVFWHSHLGCWDSNFLKFTNKENGRDDMSPHSWDFKSKVIGNIHDNPELLKESDN